MKSNVNNFITQCIEAEQCLLCIGWMQPENLNDAGYQLRLGGNHFCEDHHSYIYCYLCLSAQANIKPNIDQCVMIAKQCHVDLDDHYFFDLILQTEICDGMLRTYGESVLEYAVQRERARKCFEEYRHIVGGGYAPRQNRKRSYPYKRQVSYV